MPPEPQFAYREYFCARCLWILAKDQNWTLSIGRQRSERCGSDELFMSLGFPTDGPPACCAGGLLWQHRPERPAGCGRDMRAALRERPNDPMKGRRKMDLRTLDELEEIKRHLYFWAQIGTVSELPPISRAQEMGGSSKPRRVCYLLGCGRCAR